MVPMTAMESRKAAVMRLHSRLPHSNLFIQSNPKLYPKGFSGGVFLSSEFDW
jgi:hypothetical protein